MRSRTILTVSVRAVLALVVVGVIAACGSSRSASASPPASPALARQAAHPAMRLRTVMTGIDRPTWIGAAPGSPGLLAIRQVGQVLYRAPNGHVSTALDLRSKIDSTGNEQGLLSLAFDPHFAVDHAVYADYTVPPIGDERIVRFTMHGNVIDPRSQRLIMRIPLDASAPNHNSGQIAFGADGDLYIGVGDGGPEDDTRARGQNRSDLMGDILRIAPKPGGAGYSIPAGNPTDATSHGPSSTAAVTASANHDTGAIRPEIWAFGLRNPWRFSFDPVTHDLVIGDVGQDRYEEIDLLRGGQAASPVWGTNFGWNHLEATHPFPGGAPLARGTVATQPVVEYGHDPACSVTGGFVYRGTAFPAYDGDYLYGDYCAHWLRGFPLGHPGRGFTVPGVSLVSTTTFGLDSAGNLYVANGTTGTISELVPAH